MPFSNGVIPRLPYVLALLSFILAALYAFVARPGTPYDEPAHFGNLCFYANFKHLPVLGEPGSTYESYQSPLYYAVYSIIYLVARPLGENFAFYALRVTSALLMVPVVLLTYLILRRVFPRHILVAQPVSLFAALNASLCAIAGSIQNDMLAIALTLLISYLSILWLTDSQLNFTRTVTLATLVSLAVLTKLNTTFLVISLPLFMWVVHRQRAYRHIALFGLVVALLTGWLFVRNVRLYGDITAARGEKRYLSMHYPAVVNDLTKISLSHPRGFAMILRSTLTYLWLPVEYYRNAIHASLLARGIVAVFTLTGLAGALMAWRQCKQLVIQQDANVKQAVLYLALQYAVCLLVYLYGSITAWMVPARITLTMSIVPMLVIAGGGLLAARQAGNGGVKVYQIALWIALGVINASMLWSTYRLPEMPFYIKFAVRNAKVHPPRLFKPDRALFA